MVGKQIAIAPERIAEAKQLYELTPTPVATIAALVGVSRRTLTRRIVDWGWVPRRAPRIEADRALVAEPLAPVASAESVPAILPACVSTDEAELRRANALRVQQLVATSLAAIDRIVANVGPSSESGSERSARSMAAVARALQDMSDMSRPKDETPPDDTDDDPVPRDIDEFRLELARRIRGIIESRRSGLSRRIDGPAAEPDSP